MSTSAPVYGRSTLEIWIDLAVQSEENAARWTREWRSTPGGAQFHREFVLTCQKRAKQWEEIAAFVLAEAEKMEEDHAYQPNWERLQDMQYRARNHRCI